MRFTQILGLAMVATLHVPVTAVPTTDCVDGNLQSQVVMTPADLFAFADAAQGRGDFALAEQAYRALATNPDIELRTEARFRLAMMLADRLRRYDAAGIELRKILDEKPGAARVRLELARVQALRGNRGAAERELRAAEAAGLPPDVERTVRGFANALGALRRSGGSVELALAPDSNINRATRSDTLGTVIGDFAIDPQAKSRSGLGLQLRGQGWFQTPIDAQAMLKVNLTASGNFYRVPAFDDYAIGMMAGPEYRSGRDRLAVSAGPTWRWFGRKPYSLSLGVNATWQHPLDRRTQLRIDGGITQVRNRRNDLQNSVLWSVAGGLDRAFSARAGGGVQLFANRDAARDPGYATTGGGINLYAYRELGSLTAAVTGGYSHLESDARLVLFPRRRIDTRWTASAALTIRKFRIGAFAPIARLRWERNRSSVEIYDYRRVAGELGLTAAF